MLMKQNKLAYERPTSDSLELQFEQSLLKDSSKNNVNNDYSNYDLGDLD